MHDHPRRFFVGTKFYSPPELACSHQDFSHAHLRKIDVWCWGLLLWEVLTNGEGTKSYDFGDMQELREQGLVLDAAKRSCIAFLNSNHLGERNLFHVILDCLERSLCSNPADRSDAADLHQSLKCGINDQ